MTSSVRIPGAFRPRLGDLALALATLAVAALFATRAVPWTQTALLVAVAVSVGWCRRYPVGVAALALVAAVLGAGEPAVAVAVFVIAVERRSRVRVVVAGVAALVVMGLVLVAFWPQDVVSFQVRSLVNLGLFVGLPYAVGAYLGARRALVASLRERAERAEVEQRLRVEQARRAERSRIAREMHDALAHRISLVALHAGGLEVNPAAAPDEVERAAGQIGEHARRALTDLRDILGLLRSDDVEIDVDPVDLTAEPTLSGVPRLVESSRDAGVPVTLDAELGTEPSDLVGRTAYRVVQEGLTNVHKHAPGSAVTVRVCGEPGGTLCVQVRNARRVGGDLGPRPVGAGLGLVGLRERVHLLGGTFDAGEDDRSGYALTVSLPWPT